MSNPLDDEALERMRDFLGVSPEDFQKAVEQADRDLGNEPPERVARHSERGGCRHQDDGRCFCESHGLVCCGDEQCPNAQLVSVRVRRTCATLRGHAA